MHCLTCLNSNFGNTRVHELSDRLIRAISNWGTLPTDDDVEDLLAAGASINKLHGTLLPLHCAAMVGDRSCLQLLLDHGAQVNLLDGYKRAAIHYAAENDSFCVAILIKNGALVNIADGNHDTALHWASFKNKVECAQLLLQNGANVNAVDDNENTPLSWAAHKGNCESVKLLLHYNASVRMKNHLGYSPLHRCVGIMAIGLGSNKDELCFELLSRAAGQYDLRDSYGQLSFPQLTDDVLRNKVMNLCKNVCSLKNLCRYIVRQQLGMTYLPSAVAALPVPVLLQEYLLVNIEL